MRVIRRVPRALARTRPIARVLPAARRLSVRMAPAPASVWTGFQIDPYVDYGRFLTPEGGILHIFKDIDERLRHTIWRIFAWTAATGCEGWYLYHHSPVESVWIKVACLLALGILNWFIVAKPVEVYRRIEIRPDCMIVEGAEIFWLRFMETAWPALKPDAKGNQLLCGIYGTRFVEYATIRRFDELDRMPEVIGAHLQDAMMQLWGRAQEFQ